MTIQIVCCGEVVREDKAVQKWPCPHCGNVFIIIAKRGVRDE